MSANRESSEKQRPDQMLPTQNPPVTPCGLEQGLANSASPLRPSPVHCQCHRVSFSGTQSQPFMDILSMAAFLSNSSVNSCNSDCTAGKAGNIYYLAL